jgi:MYXO-CTERM domain-containing protein
MALDDPASSTTAGTQMDQWAGNSTAAQKFTLIARATSDGGVDAGQSDAGRSEASRPDVASDDGPRTDAASTGAGGSTMIAADAGGYARGAAGSSAPSQTAGAPGSEKGSSGCACATSPSPSPLGLTFVIFGIVVAMRRKSGERSTDRDL